MGFIYKVTNNLNGKVYIGKTLDSSIEERFKEHIKEAKVKQYNRPFHLALNKYGAENFSLELLEEVNAINLSEREKYWIAYYHSYIHDENSNGYNATRGGDGSLKYDYAKIIEYYLANEKSIVKIAEELQCAPDTINRALREYNIQPRTQKANGIQVIGYNDKETLEFKSIRQAAEFLAVRLGKDLQTIRKRITFILNHRPNQIGYGYYWKKI